MPPPYGLRVPPFSLRQLDVSKQMWYTTKNDKKGT